jgi:hypothetical protein
METERLGRAILPAFLFGGDRMIKKNADLIISILVISVGCLFFYLTLFFKTTDTTEVGAAFIPRVYTTMLVILGIMLFFQSLKSKAEDIPSDFKMVAISIGLTAGYILLTPVLGFYIATLVSVLAFLLFSRVRKPILLIVTPVGISLFVYVCFERLLRVPIPWGLFFS